MRPENVQRLEFPFSSEKYVEVYLTDDLAMAFVLSINESCIMY